MQRLISSYQKTLSQGFVPILVSDGMDALFEVEALLEAGVTVAEFTLRRPDARTAIPEIRRRFPELTLLIGSILDTEILMPRLLKKNPQMLSIDALADMGADGFVSMFDFRSETYVKYSQSHLLVPCCSTVAEALRQVEQGAHFVKVLGSYPATISALCGAPAFRFVPLFVTGGMTPEVMPEKGRQGVAIFAAGFDVMCRNAPQPAEKSFYSEQVRRFSAAARGARALAFPNLDSDLKRENWAELIPWAVPESVFNL